MKRTVCFLLCLCFSGCSQNLSPPEIPRPESTEGMDRELIEAIESLALQAAREKPYGEAFLKLAKTYHANRLNDLANQAYGQFLSHDPSNAKVWFLKGLASWTLGNLETAEECFAKTIDLRADYPAAYWRLALVRLEQGDPEAALQLVKRSLELTDGEESAKLVFARALLEMDRPNEAVSILEQLDLNEGPNSGYARFLMGSALRTTGDLETANRYLTGDNPRPSWTDPWQRELQAFELGFSGQRIKAGQLYRAGRLDEAISLLKQCIRHPDADARDWNMLGASHLGKGQLDPAIDVLLAGLDKFPNDYNLHMNLAKIYLISMPRKGQGILDKALPLLEHAASLRPDRWEPPDATGQIFNIQGKLEDALKQYEIACQLSSQVELCHWRKIFLLMDLGRFEQAEVELNQLPSDQHSSAYFLFSMAFLANQVGHHVEASEYLGKIDSSALKDAALKRKIESLGRSISFASPP